MRARPPAPGARGFRHEAFFYVDDDGYASAVAAFLRAGLEADEPVMAVLPAPRLEMVRQALNGSSEHVLMADMADVGRNPARIIPEWRRFVDASSGGPMRGVGEPLWVGRGRQEGIECHRHEWLLSRAFAADPLLWLVCPYDASGLDAADLAVARRLHPGVFDPADVVRPVAGPAAGPEPAALGPDPTAAPLWAEPFPVDDSLPSAPDEVPVDLRFGNGDLAEVRDATGSAAIAAGLEAYRAKELTLAVHEVASNVVRHTGGTGRLRVWTATAGIEGPAAVVCEIADNGRAAGPIADPMVGRERPSTGLDSGRGLWLANQLCDLVQLRTSGSGTVVRMHALLPVPA